MGGAPTTPATGRKTSTTPLGKILRIDVDTPNGPVPYSSPGDNPYAGATPGLDEIYAIGLRNPWRISFDRLTGQLFAGDVGQGNREEIRHHYSRRQLRMARHGGDPMRHSGDALPCDSPEFTAPAFEYTHGSGRCSVTGGYVYRGAIRGPSGGHIRVRRLLHRRGLRRGHRGSALQSRRPAVLGPGGAGHGSPSFLFRRGRGRRGLRGRSRGLGPAPRSHGRHFSHHGSVRRDRWGGHRSRSTRRARAPIGPRSRTTPWITIDSGANGDGDGTVTLHRGCRTRELHRVPAR